MRLMTALMILIAGPVAAHPGHIVDAAGHNHWVGGILLGAAGIAAAVGLLKGRKAKKKAEPDAEAEPA
ncbi:hypothetical protein EU805_13430 [Salipiger sp. IMCC34102]|uniref:DUF6732 family protein n=1 Tax=Salipiger sp. IMCC34102 TaxID=2510647 RepID=UPI00101C9633|nr:DUF6732 family protein [Salipiger sp. IMCC34102]RYH01652.1 hypothetical protein EU805_13430 [Salipiger sp. IMCC34102]